MLEPLDRCRRDSTLFQFTTKQLRDFIDPNHLLIWLDEQLDFAKLVAPLEARYCPGFGRPAIHPEVMVRALLVCSLYNIASFRRLCPASSENIAFRWFCFLTIDDPLFDHSGISHFIDRTGPEGFAEIFDSLNQELLRLGLLSPEMYVDSTLVKANVSGYGLAPSGMTMAEFAAAVDCASEGEEVLVAGWPIARQHPRGEDSTVFVTIEDETGDAQVILWPQVFHRSRRQLGSHVLLVRGTVSRWEGTANVIAAEVRGIHPRVPMPAAHDWR